MHIFSTCICEELRYIMKIHCTMLVLKHMGRTCLECTWLRRYFYKDIVVGLTVGTIGKTTGQWASSFYPIRNQNQQEVKHSSAFQGFSKWQHENSRLPFHHSCKWNLLQYLSKCLSAVNTFPVYFGCYDHCKIAFCIGQVCGWYNYITSCRKPAKLAYFLWIAMGYTANQWLQV